MAKETNAISLETEAATKLGKSSYEGVTNKCCTKAKALYWDAVVSSLRNYLSNLLVKYADIVKKPDPPVTYTYNFRINFIFQKSGEWNTSNNYLEGAIGGVMNEYIDMNSASYYDNNYCAGFIEGTDFKIYSTNANYVPKDFTITLRGHYAEDLKRTTTAKPLFIGNIYADDGYGLKFNGITMPSDDYVCYVVQGDSVGMNLSGLSMNPLEFYYFYPEYNYTIYIFENLFIANLLLNNDSYSYE